MAQTSLSLSLVESGADAERLDLLTRQLRDELRNLDVADVRALPAGEAAPDGSRGVDVTSVGGILVALLGSQGLVGVVAAVRAWLDRGHDAPRSVRLELGGDVLELSGASSAEQDRLVSAFLSQHGEEGVSWTADAPR